MRYAVVQKEGYDSIRKMVAIISPICNDAPRRPIQSRRGWSVSGSVAFSVKNFPQDVRQLFHLIRLLKESINKIMKGGRLETCVAVPRRDDDLEVGLRFFQSLKGFLPAHFRHVHIENYGVKPRLFRDSCERLQAALNSFHLVAEMLKHPADQLPDVLLIVDDEDPLVSLPEFLVLQCSLE